MKIPLTMHNATLHQKGITYTCKINVQAPQPLGKEIASNTAAPEMIAIGNSRNVEMGAKRAQCVKNLAFKNDLDSIGQNKVRKTWPFKKEEVGSRATTSTE